MAGLTAFGTNPRLPSYPVSNRKPPWVQMRRGTGSNNTKSKQDFCSRFWFPNIPVSFVSPIKSQNFSELRKTFSSQNTFMKQPHDHTGGEKGRMQAGCTVLQGLLWCSELRPGLGRKAVTLELGFGRKSHTTCENNPDALNCLLWN